MLTKHALQMAASYRHSRLATAGNKWLTKLSPCVCYYCRRVDDRTSVAAGPSHPPLYYGSHTKYPYGRRCTSDGGRGGRLKAARRARREDWLTPGPRHTVFDVAPSWWRHNVAPHGLRVKPSWRHMIWRHKLRSWCPGQGVTLPLRLRPESQPGPPILGSWRRQRPGRDPESRFEADGHWARGIQCGRGLIAAARARAHKRFSADSK